MKPPNVRWNIAGPAIIGVVALVVAGYLAWLTFQHDDSPAEQPAAKVATDTLVNHKGGYSVKVPRGMKASRMGAATRIIDKGRTVTVTITPTAKGTPADRNKAVLRAMVSTYRSVNLTTSQRQQVDGRAALASYGRALSKKGVALRFVLISVKGKARNFSISTFAAADSDPNKVLPRVRAITNGFHVLSAKQVARK